MAVSKRLRFEVLRRDNHTCRYCGRSAPEVKLTVDHVVPVALGGTDTADNLVAACSDCNSGKSSAAPDQQLVARVSDDAIRWVAAMRQAAEENRLHDNSEVYEAVVNAWASYRRDQIPKDYRETIDQFLAAGLPGDDIVQMARVADAKPSIYNRWSYFCGCCWTRIRKLQERAEEIVSGAQPARAAAASVVLQSIWTIEEVNERVRVAESVASGRLTQDSIDSAYCRHHEWGAGDCGDPLCRVVRAEALGWMSDSMILKSMKEDAIMDELERLDG